MLIMRILFLTDIHYGENTRYPKYEGDPTVSNFGEEFPKYLHDLKEIVQDCDLVVNLGDLIEETETAQEDIALYAAATELLNLGKPAKHVIGNHEVVNLKRPAVASVIGEKEIYYSFDMGDYHFVVLDGNREGKTYPERFQFSLEQLEWLEKDLQNTKLSVLILSHFPLATFPLDENPLFSVLGPEMAFPIRADRVKDILEASGKVLAVFNGHLHYAHEHRENGVLYYTVGSFTRNDGSHRPTTEYAIAHLEGETVTVQNMRVAGEKILQSE